MAVTGAPISRNLKHGDGLLTAVSLNSNQVRAGFVHYGSLTVQKNREVEYLLTIWGEWRAQPVYGLSEGMSPIARLLHSPGRSNMTSPAVPVFRFSPIGSRVEAQFRTLDSAMQDILVAKYELCLKPGAACRQLKLKDRHSYRWALDRAIREIARKLK